MRTFSIPGKLILAPMAGVTDRAFRELCVSFGADYCVTEMISAKAVQLKNKKSFELAALSERERPSGIQLFGDDPDVMAFAAEKMMVFAPYAIDINMGCPAPKIAAGGGGVSLMRNPALCGKIVQAVSQAVPVPVTVKIRSGWSANEINAVDVAKACEQAGAAAVAIHGRTRDQMYSGHADYGIIRQVRQAVSIPVIGNGDVQSGEDARNLLEKSGCSYLMIGRGAMGKPWIFREISAFFHQIPYSPPSLEQRMSVMEQHIRTLCSYKGEGIGMREARKHIGWYLSGIRGASAFRRRAMTLCEFDQIHSLIEDILRENREEEQD